MSSKTFEKKKAIITGGSSGIGFAAAKELAGQGARVIITGRNPEKLEQAAEKLGRDRVLPVNGSVTDMAHLDFLAETVRKEFGSLDIIFANAGIGLFRPFLKVTEEEFDKLTNLNFKGAFFTIQKLVPLMNSGGSVIINASWTYHRGLLETGSAYSATKAAVANLAQSLAGELSTKGIRVNAISPGYIKTAQFNEKIIGEQEAVRRKKDVALNRFGNADEIAKVVAFLASSDSSYINGEDILIDGGLVNARGQK